MQPADLAHELGDKNGAQPTVAYVGFRTSSPAAIFRGLRFTAPLLPNKD